MVITEEQCSTGKVFQKEVNIKNGNQVLEKRHSSSRSWRKQENSLLLPSIQSAKLLHVISQIWVAMRWLLLLPPINSTLAINRHIKSLLVPSFKGVTTTIHWTASSSPIQQFGLICLIVFIRITGCSGSRLVPAEVSPAEPRNGFLQRQKLLQNEFS